MGYLGVVQILNMLTPLLIYPHLMESLGSEKIGTLVYHQTIVLFFVIVVSFGQNILGVKEGTSKRPKGISTPRSESSSISPRTADHFWFKVRMNGP